MQDESSIKQQQLRCRERAGQEQVEILSELEFADEAISGTKRRRPGLQAMIEAAQAGRFGTLYIESLSRLGRDTLLVLRILRELVDDYGIRVVSVSEGIDSSSPQWQMMSQVLMWTHEQQPKAAATTTFRGHEHNLRSGYSVGDWCYGYTSVAVPGTEHGRGRIRKPRMQVVIHPEQAEWVRTIFRWFAVDRRPLDWITRELTRQGVPKPRKSTATAWHREIVRRILRNQKYIGKWTWGKTKTCRSSGELFRELRPLEELGKWTREAPDLRIVDDVIFGQAQVLLAASAAKTKATRGSNGRIHGSVAGTSRARHLLQHALECGLCGRTFQVVGTRGDYFGCPGYKVGACSCRTQLPRALAEETIIRVVKEHLLKDPSWSDSVYKEVHRAWKLRRTKLDPVANLESQLGEVNQQIERLVDALEKGKKLTDVAKRLEQRESRRAELEGQLLIERSRIQGQVTEPTRDWVDERLQELCRTVQAGGSQANAALRRFVGGRIRLWEQALPGRKRKYFNGRFVPNLGLLTVDSSGTTGTPELEIRLVQTPPWETIADKVKELFDLGHRCRNIAEQLRCPFPWIAKALAFWHKRQGLPVPDGRTLRARLGRSAADQARMELAKRLFGQSLPLKEIARQVGRDMNTLRAMLRSLAEKEQQPLLDGRTRRKQIRLNQLSQVEADKHAICRDRRVWNPPDDTTHGAAPPAPGRLA